MASQQAASPARRRSLRRLQRSADVRGVLAAGAQAHGSAMVVYTRRRDDDGPARAAVVAGRRIGPAVARNRAKRRLRAALQDGPPPAGLDVVVVARPTTLTLEFSALVEQLRRLLERAAAGAAVAG